MSERPQVMENMQKENAFGQTTRPKRRRARRYDLWMRHPQLDNGIMRQISDEHSSKEQREDFLRCYIAAGWTDPELRPVTCDDRLLMAEISRLLKRIARLEEIVGVQNV